MENSEESKTSLEPENKIQLLKASRWPDGQRVAVNIELSLRQPLSIHLSLQDKLEKTLVDTTIIETMDSAIELTMHLPTSDTSDLSLKAVLYDDELGAFDTKIIDLV